MYLAAGSGPIVIPGKENTSIFRLTQQVANYGYLNVTGDEIIGEYFKPLSHVLYFLTGKLGLIAQATKTTAETLNRDHTLANRMFGPVLQNDMALHSTASQKLICAGNILDLFWTGKSPVH